VEKDNHYKSFRVLRCTSILLLLSCVWANISVGQSLSIIKNGGKECWTVAVAPADSRYTLQASRNLTLWLDFDDIISGTVSNQVGAAAAERFFRLVPWSEAPPITVVVVGDSTVADLAINQNYFSGWGQGLYGYFKSNARIINLSRPGYGTKNFLTSDEEATMVVLKPEYVLVELGLVDEMAVPEVRTALPDYEQNLRTIVQIIRGFNGIPQYTPDDRLVEMFPARDAVVKKVAAEEQVYLIDLNRLSLDLMNGLGRSGCDDLWSKTFPNEWLHFSTKGAEAVAGLVVNSLPAIFGAYLRPDRVF